MRKMRCGLIMGACLASLLLVGCSPSVVKTDAVDHDLLAERLPAENLLQSVGDDEQALTPGPEWLAGIEPQKNLTFLGVSGEKQAFGVLLEIDETLALLRYLPLFDGETPLAVLTDPRRYADLETFVRAWPERTDHSDDFLTREIPLAEIEQRLVSPIPPPKQIFAAAANYPSHLYTDLALPDEEELIAQLSNARPRIFQKYPPVAAPGESNQGAEAFMIQPGPFETLAAPEQVNLPTLSGESRTVSGHLDYEVELAVVVGRDLTWEQAQGMSDDELREVVVGFLLFSDAKVRDPQAMGAIIRSHREEKVPDDNAYRVGVEALDRTLGIWDETTCHWWSYAASWGRYASQGPFLVAYRASQDFTPRMVLASRSYSSDPGRTLPPPREVPTDQLLLRQATLTTNADDYQDSLIWSAPEILRSLLNPSGNALAFTGADPELHAGDLIALGTPGGAVITSKPWWFLPMVDHLLFWKDPAFFYEMFFKPTKGYYLHPGDELFLWGEGLGYQHLKVAVPVSVEGGSD